MRRANRSVVGNSRKLTRRSSLTGAAKVVKKNPILKSGRPKPTHSSLNRRSSLVGRKTKQLSHHKSISASPVTKSKRGGSPAVIGSGGKNKSYRELLKSEEKALVEIKRLKDTLRNKNHLHEEKNRHNQQCTSEINKKIAEQNETLTQQKENILCLSQQVDALRGKNSVLSTRLENCGYSAVTGEKLEKKSLENENEMNRLEATINEAKAAISETEALQSQYSNETFLNMIRDIQVMESSCS